MYPEERESNFKIKLWRFYRIKIWSKINHIRGTTWLLRRFRNFANEVEKVDAKKKQGIKDKDWDNLAIIDAARHDVYKEILNSDADYRITLESSSGEFIKENFSEGDWSDTVVITANPFYNEKFFEKQTGTKPSDLFHTVFQVWKTDWNEQQGTVMPQKMIEKTKTAQKLFPQKRKIIHFMQPHYPFINSDTGEKGYGDAFKEENYQNVWNDLMDGKRDHKEVVQAYKDNYKEVKPHLNELAEILEGDTYVTADHGNLLGESGLYGHPAGSKAKPVRKVPWDKLPIS